jgi:hypothetical protein
VIIYYYQRETKNKNKREVKNMNICPREISRLAQYLTVMGVPFTAKPLYDGYQIIVNDNNGDYEWDAICHSGSYGHEKGLLEIMGSIVNSPYDEVEGWLTAEEIVDRVFKAN